RPWLVDLTVGGGLLDVYWRRKGIDGQATRIDDADAISGQEPQSSVRGSGDLRAIQSGERAQRHAIGSVEHSGLHSSRRIVNGRVQFRRSNAYETAGRVQPHRMIVVFQAPVHGVAGQSVPAAHRNDMPVLHMAEAGFHGDPERTGLVEPE